MWKNTQPRGRIEGRKITDLFAPFELSLACPELVEGRSLVSGTSAHR